MHLKWWFWLTQAIIDDGRLVGGIRLHAIAIYNELSKARDILQPIYARRLSTVLADPGSISAGAVLSYCSVESTGKTVVCVSMGLMHDD